MRLRKANQSPAPTVSQHLSQKVIIMVQSTIGQVLTNIEREIQAEVHNTHQPRQPSSVDFVTPMTAAPDMAMPDYVEHSDGATEIGRLSAEAVVREYEAAAKDIEALGVELVEHVKQCEAMARDALKVTDELKETANRYRDEAKRVSLADRKLLEDDVGGSQESASSCATRLLLRPRQTSRRRKKREPQCKV